MDIEFLIVGNEKELRIFSYLAVFLIMAVAEFVAPKRKLMFSRMDRWPSNILLTVLNTVLMRLILPATGIEVAVLAFEKGWGLLHFVNLAMPLKIILAVILLDLVIYWQHVVFHRVGFLWRLHRMHHADLDYDVTTGARFHPLEILISMGVKFVTILVLGVPATAVVLFEILLNATAMFNHSNVSLPRSMEGFVRSLLVTPDMHRVHHSILPKETHSNYGFCLPWWDRLFGTYIAKHTGTDESLVIGLPIFREKKFLRLDQLLAIPFRK